MAKLTLQERLRANKARSIAQADATANKEKLQKIQQQKQLQKQKKENDIAYQKHLIDLAEYEKQKQQYRTSVQQLEAQAQAEAKQREAEIKQAEQKRIDQQKAINDSFDEQIKSLGRQTTKISFCSKIFYKSITQDIKDS